MSKTRTTLTIDEEVLRAVKYGTPHVPSVGGLVGARSARR
jgi:hypothetical protein